MAKHNLTADTLREHLHYDPEIGVFTWIKPRAPSVKSGDIAGNLTVDGYWVICIFAHRHKAHRLAFFVPDREVTRTHG